MSQKTSSFAERLDIFGFTPVPTGQRISTRKSRWGTYIFISVYLLYILKTLHGFIYSNSPRVNQFSNRLDDDVKYKAPRMAFAFLTGDNLNISIYDPKYFTFKFQQNTVFQDPKIPDQHTPLALTACRPDWLKPIFDVYCPPDNVDIDLQGLKFGSPVNKYPSMEVVLCSGDNCANLDDIKWTIMTGRLFVFLEQYASYDYISGKKIIDDSPYVSYYYFLIYDQFNRAELKIEAENITMKADMMTSLFNKKVEGMTYAEQMLYVSRVPAETPKRLFQWYCNMADTTKIITVSFETSLDMLSKIGAMWTLMFTAFAFYFLNFNKARYYKRKPHMMNFDDKISPLVLKTEGDSKTEASNSLNASLVGENKV